MERLVAADIHSPLKIMLKHDHMTRMVQSQGKKAFRIGNRLIKLHYGSLYNYFEITLLRNLKITLRERDGSIYVS